MGGQRRGTISRWILQRGRMCGSVVCARMHDSRVAATTQNSQLGARGPPTRSVKVPPPFAPYGPQNFVQTAGTGAQRLFQSRRSWPSILGSDRLGSRKLQAAAVWTA